MVKATDRVDEVERPAGMRQIQSGGLDHALGIGITSREPEAVSHHLHRSLGDVHTVESRAPGDELTAQGPVAESDLQRRAPARGFRSR